MLNLSCFTQYLDFLFLIYRPKKLRKYTSSSKLKLKKLITQKKIIMHSILKYVMGLKLVFCII